MVKNKEPICYKCGETDESSLEDLFGYKVCPACKIQLGLYHDETIKKHVASFEKAKNLNPQKPSYLEEVDSRLIVMKKDYISKRIKLLHIRHRIGEILN